MVCSGNECNTLLVCRIDDAGQLGIVYTSRPPPQHNRSHLGGAFASHFQQYFQPCSRLLGRTLLPLVASVVRNFHTLKYVFARIIVPGKCIIIIIFNWQEGKQGIFFCQHNRGAWRCEGTASLSDFRFI